MRRRTATGVTAARTTLSGPKSATAATSGFRRGPGSQETIASSTTASRSGTARTAKAPSPITPRRRPGGREPVGEHAARPVADREPGQDDADEGAPDEERVPEVRREDAARRDLDPEEDGAREEDGGADGERLGPLAANGALARPDRAGGCCLGRRR